MELGSGDMDAVVASPEVPDASRGPNSVTKDGNAFTKLMSAAKSLGPVLPQKPKKRSTSSLRPEGTAAASKRGKTTAGAGLFLIATDCHNFLAFY